MNRAKDAAREIAESLHGSIATPSEGRADNVRSAVQALRRNSNVISTLVAKPLPDLKQLVDRNSDEVLKLLLPDHLGSLGSRHDGCETNSTMRTSRAPVTHRTTTWIK